MSLRSAASVELTDNNNQPDYIDILRNAVVLEDNQLTDNNNQPEYIDILRNAVVEDIIEDNHLEPFELNIIADNETATEVGDNSRDFRFNVRYIWSRFARATTLSGAETRIDTEINEAGDPLNQSRIHKMIWVLSMVLLFLAIIGYIYNLGLEEGSRESRRVSKRVATIVKVFDEDGKEVASVHTVWR